MPLTSGHLYRQGSSPQTETVVSSRFKLYAPLAGVGNFYRMGVCSSFAQSEQRTVEAVRGLGFGDQVAELVPGVTAPMSLSIHRTALYLANLMQVLGYNAGASGAVRSLKHHKWPFDIKTEIVFSQLVGDTGQNEQAQQAIMPNESGFNSEPHGNLYAIVTLYEGCWLTSYNTTFQVDQAAVAEDCQVEVTDIMDNNGSIYGEFLNSGNDGVAGNAQPSLIFGSNSILQVNPNGSVSGQ